MGHHAHRASANRRSLTIVFALTAVFLVAEVIGGFVTGSLALLADAGHMLTDVAALALALVAIRISERPATPDRTYGYHRVEILAAFVNAMFLLLISLYILWEAFQRLVQPREVEGLGMLVIASIGLAVNLVGIVLLRPASQQSLNMRGAYLEVLADAVSSVGAIVAGVVILTTGWYYADSIVSLAIALFIVPRGWMLLRDAVGILLEGAPAHVDVAAVRDTIRRVEGVEDVHDLHVWTITSGVHAMSAHVVVGAPEEHARVLESVQQIVLRECRIEHVTVQIEPPGFAEGEMHL